MTRPSARLRAISSRQPGNPFSGWQGSQGYGAQPGEAQGLNEERPHGAQGSRLHAGSCRASWGPGRGPGRLCSLWVQRALERSTHHWWDDVDASDARRRNGELVPRSASAATGPHKARWFSEARWRTLHFRFHARCGFRIGNWFSVDHVHAAIAGDYDFVCACALVLACVCRTLFRFARAEKSDTLNPRTETLQRHVDGKIGAVAPSQRHLRCRMTWQTVFKREDPLNVRGRSLRTVALPTS